MNVLVCGGTGYIGSHICVELLNAGYEVTVIDDFSIQDLKYWGILNKSLVKK